MYVYQEDNDIGAGDGDVAAAGFHLGVNEAAAAHQLGPPHLKIDEEDGMVEPPHGVGFRIADADREPMDLGHVTFSRRENLR